MASTPQTPDLATILQTLSGLSRSQPQQPYVQNVPGAQTQFQPTQAPQQQWNPPTEPRVQSNEFVDPTTIIHWPHGLRCVMRTTAKNEGILVEVRKMIKVQHEHEEQWFRGRQDLVKKQQARGEGQKKLDDVLKLIGGAPSGGTPATTPEALAKELSIFDTKVHRAQLQMIREMNQRLRNMGIPFFGTRNELVVLASENRSENVEKGKIHEFELIKLQKKMLELLEDLCKEGDN